MNQLSVNRNSYSVSEIPVLGLTPFEALLAGVTYLNPMFNPAKSFWMNPTCLLTSQHPDTETIGKPYVYNIHLNNPSEIVSSIRDILAMYDRGGGFDSYLHETFTFEQFVARLDLSLRDERICAAYTSDEVVVQS